MVSSTEFKYPEKVFVRGYQPTYEGHPGQIKRAVDLILKSKRPVLYAGVESSYLMLEGTHPFC